MSPSEPSEELTPTEQRLQQHLELLRGGGTPPVSLTASVVRSARWQQSVRTPLLTAARLAAAALDAVRLLLGGSRP